MADDAPHYHGTHVAGTIGAIGDNGIGVIGQSPHVTLMPLKFLAANGSGYTSNAIQAIDFAVAHGAKIISNSWGGTQGSPELEAAIQRAQAAGVLFVVAAGNGGNDGISDNNDVVPTYPASYHLDNMIVVAATDQSDNLTSFSNYGPSTVDVGAPGLDIYSTMNGGKYQFMSGTSMATPLVSGVAATLFALRPDLSYKEVKRAIIENADQVPGLQGRIVSNGRVNAYRAIASLAGSSPSPTPTPTPTPTPIPTPTPTPAPPPNIGTARAPLLNGQPQLVTPNPYMAVAIDYDVSEFNGAAGAYIEVSRPGTPFSNPNDTHPDPMRLTFAFAQGTRNRLMLMPSQNLPGWGVYGIRVIPLTAQGYAAGLFSNPSVLELRPF
jgi:subtilisin family serine protease